MAQIKNVISKISGRRGSRDYESLYYVLLTAMNCDRRNVKIKDVYAEASVHLNIKPQSVNKAISRVNNDIWDHGDKDKLFDVCGHNLIEKPSPKDLIFMILDYIDMENEKMAK